MFWWKYSWFTALLVYNKVIRLYKYTYTCVHADIHLFILRFFAHLGYYKILSGSLYYTLGACCLAILYIAVCISEKVMAPHSSTLAWKIPWMEEPGRLQSMGSQLSNFTFTFHFHALEKGMATYSSILAWNIPMEGTWRATVRGVTKSRTQLSD